jgi:hypothetical protein
VIFYVERDKTEITCVINSKEVENLKGRYLYRLLIVTGIIGILVAGCGSSGSDTEQSVNGLISGAAVKGPVAGADISAYAIGTGGMKGELIGTSQTDQMGNFTVMAGDHSGPVLLEMTGGHYTDEATGNTMYMQQGDVMTSAIPVFTTGEHMGNIQISPLTSMSQVLAQNMPGGMTGDNITTAHDAVGNYFGVTDILRVHPMNPLMNNSGAGSDHDMIHYGMALAAMSQYAQAMGMSASSEAVTIFMNDISDGHFDGMMNGSGIMMHGGMLGGNMMHADAGTVGLADAMEDFISSSMNMSGVTLQEMQTIIDQLHMSSGVVQQ